MNPGLGWGCEIAPSGVTLVRWSVGASEPSAIAWRPLSPGAVEVSPVRDNLTRPDEVRQSLAGCLESLGRAAGSSARAIDVALIIPDQAARVFFLGFDQFPSQASQAIPLVRWKLKKSVPFDIDTAMVSYMARSMAAEWDVSVVVSPAAVVRQYEELVEGLGLKPRFVTLSTLGSLGLVPVGEPRGADPGSCLLAKYSPPWLTATIIHEGSVRLFRTSPIASNGDAGSSGKLREVLEAVHPAAAYFQDHFGRSLDCAFLSGLEELSEELSESLSTELNLPTKPLLDQSPSAGSGMEPSQAERNLAALMGVLRTQRHA
jgi:type IV pilus assembly protein PilM